MEVRRKDERMRERLRAQEQNEVLPAGYCPEGIAVERLSPEIMQIVEVALPVQGRALIAHLLSYATCASRQTYSAWWMRFLEEEKRAETALVIVKSLGALARSEDAPCGPDRYYQLVLVLEALQVLKRQVHRSREAPLEYVTILRLDLSAHPRSLSTLLRSCSQMERTYTNPKVKRLLMQVRERLQTTMFREVAPTLHQMVDQMERLVRQYQEQELPQAPLLALIQQVLASIMQTEAPQEASNALEAERCHPQLPVTPLSSSEQQIGGRRLSVILPEDQEARMDKKLPDVGKKVKPRSSPRMAPSIYQGVEASPVEESFLPREGKKLPGDGVKQVCPEQRPVYDAQKAATAVAPRRQAISGEEAMALQRNGFLLSCGKKPPADVSISDHLLSEKDLQKEKTLIDTGVAGYYDPRSIEEIRREAGMYARLFDGQERWMGKLVTCVRSYPPALRRLAAIDTLYHLYEPDWRGRPKSPGAWFCRTCERFANREADIPEVVRRWAATELDYDTIAAALRLGERVPEPQDLTPLKVIPGSEMSLHMEPAQERDQRPHRQVPPFHARMDRARAEQLATQMVQDVAADPVGAQVQVLEGRNPGTWMVLLLWEDGVEVPIENEAEWEDYWDGAQECLAIQAKYAQ